MNEPSHSPAASEIVFGTHPADKKFIDLTGRRFNHLTVLGFHSRSCGRTKWWVKCECGTVKPVASGNLVSGSIKSCGCKKSVYNSLAHKTHGMTRSREFTSWVSMKTRCGNPNDPFYYRYGGRGISVCERWGSFSNFFEDMGKRPPGKSLDRIDSNGNYEPSNCRWASVSEQARNTSSNRMLTVKGLTKCLSDWSQASGLKPSTISERLKRGYSHEEAVLTPVKVRLGAPGKPCTASKSDSQHS